jgi:nitrogen regulatory protein PII
MQRIDVTIRPCLLDDMRQALDAAGIPSAAMTFSTATHIDAHSTVTEVYAHGEHVFEMTPVVTLEVLVVEEQMGTACRIIQEVMTVGRQRGRVVVVPIANALTETDSVPTPKPATVPAHKRMEGYIQ